MKNNDGNDENYMQKQKVDLIVIGNQNSGKTSLIKRFVNGEKVFSHFYTPTLGINLEKRQIKIDNTLVSVSIWDTAGQEKFLSITKNYFHKADGVLIIFDLTDKNSFQKVSKFWIHEVNQKASQETSQVIIGNKIDMTKERLVSHEEAKNMALSLKLPYFETSAKTGQNVEQVIQWIVRDCLKKIRIQSGGGVYLPNANKTESSSCFGGIKNIFSGVFQKKNIEEGSK